MLRAIFLLSLSGIAVMLLIGCSGTSQPQVNTSGRALITIQWPDRTRMIPIAANTIQINILQGTTIIASHVVDRPATGTTSAQVFLNLPLGQLTATAAAFASNDTTATPLATGSTTLLITANAQTTFSIRMGSTITSLQLTPLTQTLQLAQSVALGVSAYDSQHDLVLVTNASLLWTAAIAPGTIAAGAVVTVNSSGLVTAVSSGTAVVTVTDTEAGVSATALITVVSPTVITITPGSASVPSGNTQSFTASVTGGSVSTQSVSWSILEGSAGGTIDANGNYTAPSTPGIYHVLAIWSADASVSASATVTVTAATVPPVTVTIAPANVSMSVQATQTFTAIVTGTTNQAVTWQLEESWGGTLTANGVYTAPMIAGTYHIIATSVFNPNDSATVTVNVTAGGASWTIE